MLESENTKRQKTYSEHVSGEGLLLNRVIPFNDESLFSIEIRLASENYCERVNWIDSKLKSEDGWHYWSNPNARLTTGQLAMLSTLSGLSVDELYNATIHRFGKVLCMSETLEQDEYGRHFIPYKQQLKVAYSTSSKFCPLCLIENTYHRIHWDLFFVTACLKHKTLLKDRCSTCSGKITVAEIVAGKHRCGFDLRSDKTLSIRGDKLTLASQHYIQELLEVDSNARYSNKPKEQAFLLANPLLMKLLEAIFVALRGIDREAGLLKDYAGQLDEVSSKKKWRNRISNRDVNIFLKVAFNTLRNWPHNYFAFLDDLKRRVKERYLVGLSREFWHVKYQFDKLIPEDDFDFVRAAFQEYLVTRWEGVIQKQASFFKGRQNVAGSRRRFIGREEASRILRVNSKVISALIRSGELQVKHIKRGKKVLRYLIVMRGIRKLQKKWSGNLTLKEATQRLAVGSSTLTELVNSGFLKTHDIEKGINYQVVREKDLQRFENRFLSVDKTTAHKNGRRQWVDIKGAARICGFVVWPTAKILNLVENKVIASYVDPSKHGLNSLRFRIDDLRECTRHFTVRFLPSRKKSNKGHRDIATTEPDKYHKMRRNKQIFISLYRACLLLGVSRETIKKVAAKGLLPIFKKGGKHISLIPLESFIRFRREYVFSHEAAIILNVNILTVYSWFQSGRIEGSRTILLNGGRRYLFNRSDLLRYAPGKTMTIPDCAAYLYVNRRYVERLIATGIISPIGEERKRKRSHTLLLWEDIDRIKKQMNETIGVPELSRAIGASREEIVTMMGTKELVPTSGPGIDGGRVYLFNRVEVEPYIKLYSSADVARLTNTSYCIVRRWTKEGKLKAVSGPKADGKSNYRFQLMSVRRFQRTRITIPERGKKLQCKLLTLREAAAMLGIDKKKIWRLINGGLIKPYSGPTIDGGKTYYVIANNIRRLGIRLKEKVMSVPEAAALVGLSADNFRQRWIYTGKVKSVASGDKQAKIFIRKKDVEKIVLLKRKPRRSSSD